MLTHARVQAFWMVVAFTATLAACGRAGPDAVAHTTASDATIGGGIVGLNGKCIDDPNGAPTDGNWLQIWTCYGNVAQTWSYANGAFVGPGGKCMDVRGGDSTSGTPVQMWDCNGTAAQQWAVTADKNIVGIGGKCLDVLNGDGNNGTHLQIWDCTGSAAQIWDASATNATVSNSVPGPSSCDSGPTVLTTSSGGSINDSSGNTWTLTSDGRVQENGSDVYGGSGTSELTYVDGTIYGQDAGSGNWYALANGQWNGPQGNPISNATCGTNPGGGPGTPLPNTGDITVDWSTVVRQINSKSFGVNCPACFNPAYTSRNDFVTTLKRLVAGGGLIRLHGWGMLSTGDEGWLDDNGNWNAAKIHDALAPLAAAGLTAQMVIDIPAGAGGDGDIHDTPRLVQFTSDLVRIVNVDNGFGVKYWEFPNEQELNIDLSGMASLLSQCSQAMKSVDPTIHFGGPAVMWPSDYVVQLLQAIPNDLDFLSMHTYGGDGTQDEATSYASAQSAVDTIAGLRPEVDAVSPTRHIEMFLDEYNYGWNYAPQERDNRGAVYDAIIELGIVNAGADASAHWSGMTPYHDMTLVDEAMNLYPPGDMVATFGAYVRGAQVATTIDDTASLLALASKSNTAHTLVMVNRSGGDRQVSVGFNGWNASSFTEYSITDNGFSSAQSLDPASIAQNGVSLPAQSVVVLVAQ